MNTSTSLDRRIINWVRRLSEPEQAAPWVRRAGGALTALAVVLIAALAAEMTWRALVPKTTSATEPIVEAPASPGPANRQAERDSPFAGLEQAHLFGAPPDERADEEPEIPAEARETRLDLALKGVVSTGLEDEGAAIIDAEGRQAVYLAGTEIMDGAVLERVEQDRVILSRDGDFEMLTMDREEHDLSDAEPIMAGREALETMAVQGGRGSDGERPPENAPERLEVPDPAETAEPQGEAGAEDAEADAAIARSEIADLEDRFREDPGHITRMIGMQPQMSGGSIEGFRLSPHDEEGRELMERMGLRDGDVVTAVDGVEVTDRGRLRQLAEELETTSRLRVQVERDGREQELTLRID